MDEGKISGLKPQAEQIQASAAAGSSLRQDNRADCGREKIRPVNCAVHPGVCAGQDTAERKGAFTSHAASAPGKATLPQEEARTPPLSIS